MASAGAGGNSTVLPAASKALQRRLDERKLQEHRDRVSAKLGQRTCPAPPSFSAAAEDQAIRGQWTTKRLCPPKAESEKTAGECRLLAICGHVCTFA